MFVCCEKLEEEVPLLELIAMVSAQVSTSQGFDDTDLLEERKARWLPHSLQSEWSARQWVELQQLLAQARPFAPAPH